MNNQIVTATANPESAPKLQPIRHTILMGCIALFAAACGGGGGGSGTSNVPAAADVAWLLNTSSLRLNGGSGTGNVALNALPDNSAVLGRLRTEYAKANRIANLYYNFTTIYGKYEGRAGSSPIAPGTWSLEANCSVASRAGECNLISDTSDAYHVVTGGNISPYFVGTVDRDGDGTIAPACDGTNAATCESKTASSIFIEPGLSAAVDVQPIMTANGIAMIQYRGKATTASFSDPYDYVSYGAWMSYSGFFAEAYLYSLATGRSQENSAATVGITTGSNPAPPSGQTLTWNGVMVGIEGSQAARLVTDPYIVRDFDPVQGDATVTVRDSNGDLEFGVSFTDIFYLNPAKTGTISNITWTDEQITSNANGRFTSTQHKLKAAFYGSNHEEVAGTYEKVDGTTFLVGSFGAKK